MSRKSLMGAICLTFGLAGVSAAQNPTQNPTQQPAQPVATAQSHPVTMEGCLVREKDVPGRPPNAVERAGVMEDFILTNVKVIKGAPLTTADASAATGTSGTAATGTAGVRTGEQPTGTSGASAMMFEVRGLNDTELEQFVGQRVEIEGTVDPADLADRSREKVKPEGEPAGDLPELKGVVIRKASSDQPCSPSAPKK